ncbi:MAG: S1 RNA-binding domain-containing protein, partial [Candidatus Eremiobacteraeota bacterium]|nr:S1 RNA-binding domain-containing protein [Candidatus Eremiobacteraeota bacterium]
ELSDYKVVKPSEVLKPDQPVKVKVIDVKADQRRITLSIRQASGGSGGPVPASASSGSGGGFTIGDRLPANLKAMLGVDDDQADQPVAKPEAKAEAKAEPKAEAPVEPAEAAAEPAEAPAEAAAEVESNQEVSN